MIEMVPMEDFGMICQVLFLNLGVFSPEYFSYDDVLKTKRLCIRFFCTSVIFYNKIKRIVI